MKLTTTHQGGLTLPNGVRVRPNRETEITDQDWGAIKKDHVVGAWLKVGLLAEVKGEQGSGEGGGDKPEPLTHEEMLGWARTGLAALTADDLNNDGKPNAGKANAKIAELAQAEGFEASQISAVNKKDLDAIWDDLEAEKAQGDGSGEQGSGEGDQNQNPDAGNGEGDKNNGQGGNA